MSSPRQDLEAIEEMKKYKQYRPQVAEKCLTSMANHTWYLHPSLIPFSLLDPEVPDDMKSEISRQILEVGSEGDTTTKYEKNNISWFLDDQVQTPSLDLFVKKDSRLIFNLLDMTE